MRFKITEEIPATQIWECEVEAETEEEALRIFEEESPELHLKDTVYGDCATYRAEKVND